MLFKTSWLNTIFTPTQKQSTKNIDIHQVNTDSRQYSKQSLFIPLVGEQFDGHAYLKGAITNGAVAAFWQKDRTIPESIPDDFPIYIVEDTTAALQELAKAYREKINPTVIGITGSNGKTTTKDLVTSVVKTVYKTHATVGNFNNQIGLPLTILAMPAHTEVLILEMGMNGFKEIELLSDIAMPDYSVITNIGESHMEYLGSREGIVTAKLEIRHGMQESGVLIIDGDEPLLLHTTKPDCVIRCGWEKENDILIHDISIKEQYTQFRVNDYAFQVPLLGKHHAKNAAYAFIIGEQLNIKVEDIRKGLESLNLTSMRFEISKGQDGVSIINDAYNASPTSMIASIDVVKQMKNYQNKVLVLGDMFELGDHSKQLHASVAEAIEQPITHVYTYGQDSKMITDQLHKKKIKIDCQHFDDETKLIEKIKKLCEVKTLILFKASRGMQFERLIQSII